jgi:hypothetical protein
MATETLTPADELLEAIELLAPPKWEPPDRAPLEPRQVPPAGPWDVWILEGGRGCGKTEACSRYFATYMREHPGTRGRTIAPTNGDAVEACVRGPSGLMAMDPEIRFIATAAGGGKVHRHRPWRVLRRAATVIAVRCDAARRHLRPRLTAPSGVNAVSTNVAERGSTS